MSLIDDLKTLCDKLEALPQPPVVLPALHVEDISEKYEGLLTPKAAGALAEAKKSTLYALDLEKGPSNYSRSIYLSLIVHTPAGIDKAAMLLCNEVNKLAEKGVLRGHLAKLSLLRLADHRWLDLHEYEVPPNSTSTYGVFIFPHVALDWKEEGIEFSGEAGAIANDIEPEAAPPPAQHSPTCGICKMMDESRERFKAMLLADDTKTPAEKENLVRLLDCKPSEPCMLDECLKCKGGPASAG